MGILGLSKLIAAIAPYAIKENDIKAYYNRKVAVDASMSLYQFLIAVRIEGAQLTTSNGQITSHLFGTFNLIISMIDNGIKPVFVFDGKPPDLKSGELAKRTQRRDQTENSLKQAQEAGDRAEIEKFKRRLVRVTKEHTREVKELLSLMGIPYIEAPSEAEAQCAALVKSGKVYATVTEDMDALTFGSSILLRRMKFSEPRKMYVQEFSYQKVLEGFELTSKEFVDLCILLGCDYCDGIKGIGPKRAIELINRYRDIETILENIDRKKYLVPDKWNYKMARELFLNPDVKNVTEIDLKWTEPDEEGLVKYLCCDRQFNEDRVRSGVKKLLKSKTSQIQGRLDDFFKITSATTVKRKSEDSKKRVTNKKPKISGGGGQCRRPK